MADLENNFCEIDDKMFEDDVQNEQDNEQDNEQEDEQEDEQEKETTEEEVSTDLDTKRKVRMPSVVWQHFEKIFDDNGILLHIKCNYCNTIYSKKSSTTTLGDHWRIKHSKIQPGGVGSIEMAFNNSQVKLKGDNYLDSLNKLVNWVIVECQPFRIVDSISFREFIKSLNSGFQVSSRQTLRNKIDDKFTSYKDNMIKMFQVIN